MDKYHQHNFSFLNSYVSQPIFYPLRYILTLPCNKRMMHATYSLPL